LRVRAQGVALLYSNGTPSGFASPALRWLMTGAVAGVTPVVVLMVLFILFGVTLLGRTVFGRWVYALGNSPRAWGAEVTVKTVDGRDINAVRREAKGDPENPVTAEELSIKAKALLIAGGMTPERADLFISEILDLIDDRPVRSLSIFGPSSDRAAKRPVRSASDV
jgi:hypothetical protein